MTSEEPAAAVPCFAHVCLFRLEREVTDEEWSTLRKYEARFLQSKTCLHYRFSRNISAKAAGFDLILFSIFASEQAKQGYVAAPLHDELAVFMNSFVAGTVVADSLEALVLPARPEGRA